MLYIIIPIKRDHVFDDTLNCPFTKILHTYYEDYSPSICAFIFTPYLFSTATLPRENVET